MSLVSFAVKDKCCLDCVQHQYRSFDQYMCCRVLGIGKHCRVARAAAY